MVVILGDTIETLVNEHGSDYGASCIEDAVCRETEYRHSPFTMMEDEAQCDKGQSGENRIYDHCPDIEFQCFLRLCADTHHTDAD